MAADKSEEKRGPSRFSNLQNLFVGFGVQVPNVNNAKVPFKDPADVPWLLS